MEERKPCAGQHGNNMRAQPLKTSTLEARPEDLLVHFMAEKSGEVEIGI